MFPLKKYKYIVLEKDRKVIALSTYDGKTVRGVAVCSDADEFDVQKGKELAAARCALKIAHRRLRNANETCAFSIRARDSWDNRVEKDMKFVEDATKQVEEAIDNLHTLLLNL